MKELLTAIKNKLQDDITDVRKSDVYITPDIDYIPAQAMKPCIGIKDGKVVRKELTGDYLELEMYVSVVLYFPIIKEETCIIGDDTQKGILDMAQDIHASLDQQLLGITGMQYAFSTEETASTLCQDGEDVLLRKVITYKYEKEKERP